MTSFRMRVLLLGAAGYLAVLLVMPSAVGQEQPAPNAELQRAAMKRFAFLVGKWSGGVRWFPRGDTLELNYTEDVHYEQDGLVLRIKGDGRRASDGRLVIGGVDLISYDDQAGIYRIRGSNHQEGVLKIDEDWKGMTIDFTTPPQRTTRAVLRVNEEGYWTEMHWVIEGSNAPWMFLTGVLGRQQELPPQKTGPASQRAAPQEKTE
jgi:hypothetical protein